MGPIVITSSASELSTLFPHHLHSTTTLLPHHFFTTSSPHPHHFFTTSSLLPHHFFTTSSLLPHHFFTISLLLPHHLLLHYFHTTTTTITSHSTSTRTSTLSAHLLGHARLLTTMEYPPPLSHRLTTLYTRPRSSTTTSCNLKSPPSRPHWDQEPVGLW